MSVEQHTPEKYTCCKLPEVAVAFSSAESPSTGSLQREMSKVVRLGWCRMIAIERQRAAVHDDKSPPATDTFTKLEFLQSAVLRCLYPHGDAPT